LGWFGSLVLLVHAGEHFNALLPWLALIAMVVVAASGMVGAVLLKRALEIVRENAKGTPDSPNAVLDAATVDLMKKWRSVHMPLNAVFVVLALLHILSAAWLKPW
jgi:cytochrome b561